MTRASFSRFSCVRASRQVLIAVFVMLGALLATASASFSQTIAGGARHTVAISQDLVWTWGGNSNGQLADDTTTSRPTPASIALSNIVAVAAGGYHTMFLDSAGYVYVAEYNSYQRLGLGPNLDPPGPFDTPRLVPGLSNVIRIAAGTYHSMALTSDGTVYSWGHNGEGQLGDGTLTTRSEPVAVFTGAVAITAGTFHSLAVGNTGQAFAWGDNSTKQLGDGTQTDRLAPTVVSDIGGAIAAAAIVMAVTSQILRPAGALGEVLISDWQGAGLPKASLIKPVLTTIEQRLILRKLGALQGDDVQALRSVLRQILG